MGKDIRSFTISDGAQDALDLCAQALGISFSEVVERSILSYVQSKIDKDVKENAKEKNKFYEQLKRQRGFGLFTDREGRWVKE